MRFLVALVLTGALAVVGCGDDEANGTGGTGATGGTGGTGGAGGTGGTGGGTGGTGGGTGGSGGSTGADPVITNIAWAPVAGCVVGQESQYTITVTVEDTDSTVPDAITYDGSVDSCTPGIESEETTVTCPNVANYDARAVVEDETGNFSDTVMFILPNDCQSGSTQ